MGAGEELERSDEGTFQKESPLTLNWSKALHGGQARWKCFERVGQPQ